MLARLMLGLGPGNELDSRCNSHGIMLKDLEFSGVFLVMEARLMEQKAAQVFLMTSMQKLDDFRTGDR